MGISAAEKMHRYRARQRADQKVLLVNVSNVSMLAQMFIDIGWLEQHREDDNALLALCVERLIEMDLAAFIQERSQ